MRPLRDPAPSRLAYRLNRLMLTPRFRYFLRFGLPLLVLVALGAFWASDEARVEEAYERIAEVRRDIEERPEFMVQMMAVENASPSVAREVRAFLSLDFPVSSFDLDLEQLQDDLETLNIVASASLHIRSGGVLEVKVEERQPAVLWRAADRLVMLDATGHEVAAISARADRPDLPLLVGSGAGHAVAEALQLYLVAAPLAERIRGLRRVGERRWDVVLDREQRILLPETDPVPALQKVVALDAVQDLLARDLAVIDFRNPRRPVLRLTSAAIDTFYDTDASPASYD